MSCDPRLSLSNLASFVQELADRTFASFMSLLGARTLLGAPGIVTRSFDVRTSLVKTKGWRLEGR